MLQAVEQPTPVQYITPLTPPISTTASPVPSTLLEATNPPAMTITSHHHILIVTGPAGCGKSTVAKYLSDRYGFDYIEGDEVSTNPSLVCSIH
jgi:gluconokinase